MNFHKLRIYDHSADDDNADNQVLPFERATHRVRRNTTDQHPSPTKEATVRVRVGQVLPLLADAMETNRLWLRDFERDTMAIPQDLYEVLLAYQRLRKSEAA